MLQKGRIFLKGGTWKNSPFEKGSRGGFSISASILPKSVFGRKLDKYQIAQIYYFYRTYQNKINGFNKPGR
jgi:hypothetical protein